VCPRGDSYGSLTEPETDWTDSPARPAWLEQWPGRHACPTRRAIRTSGTRRARATAAAHPASTARESSTAARRYRRRRPWRPPGTARRGSRLRLLRAPTRSGAAEEPVRHAGARCCSSPEASSLLAWRPAERCLPVGASSLPAGSVARSSTASASPVACRSRRSRLPPDLSRPERRAPRAAAGRRALPPLPRRRSPRIASEGRSSEATEARSPTTHAHRVPRAPRSPGQRASPGEGLVGERQPESPGQASPSRLEAAPAPRLPDSDRRGRAQDLLRRCLGKGLPAAGMGALQGSSASAGLLSMGQDRGRPQCGTDSGSGHTPRSSRSG